MNSFNHYHVVLFSGGFDSTAVLLDVLNKIKDKENEGIMILSVEAWFLTKNKMKLEREARKKIFKYFENKYPEIWHTRVGNNVIHVDLDNDKSTPGISYGGGGGLYQPELWASIISPFLVGKDCTVYLGYLKDDQGDYERIKNIWESSIKMVNPSSTNTVNVLFPFKDSLKEDILMYLYDIDKELIDICSCCELPDENEKFCGACYSCAEMIRSMINVCVKSIGHRREFFIKRLHDWFNCDFSINFNNADIAKAYDAVDTYIASQSDESEETDRCDYRTEENDEDDEKCSTDVSEYHSASTIPYYMNEDIKYIYKEFLHELKETTKALRQISGRLH